ncbi:MAG: hypothetical protein LBF94_04400 [Puniceicoccales bacterium]|nr:hypothetical protein [Puniceicoccales bacterium]
MAKQDILPTAIKRVSKNRQTHTQAKGVRMSIHSQIIIAIEDTVFVVRVKRIQERIFFYSYPNLWHRGL